MSQQDSQFWWEATRVQNLFRYQSSGTYFARLEVGGKSIRQSLEPTVFSVAQLRLSDAIEASRKIEEPRQRFCNGKMRFGDAVQIHRDQLDANTDLRTCGVDQASRRTSKRSIGVQIQASALARPGKGALHPPAKRDQGEALFPLAAVEAVLLAPGGPLDALAIEDGGAARLKSTSRQRTPSTATAKAGWKKGDRRETTR